METDTRMGYHPDFRLYDAETEECIGGFRGVMPRAGDRVTVYESEPGSKKIRECTVVEVEFRCHLFRGGSKCIPMVYVRGGESG